MVFCRGCGKEIHETAPTCPHCGAPQRGALSTASARGAIMLTIWAAVWSLVFFGLELFFITVVVNAANPTEFEAATKRATDVLGPGVFLVAIVLGVALSIAGKLPGPKKA